MTDWREVKLGDLGEVVTGKTPSTKVDAYWCGDIPFITPKDIQSSKHIFETERYLSNEGMLSVKGSILPKNAICVSCIGNIGYVSMTTKQSISNQQINSIIANDENDANFVYYLMKSLWPYFKNYEGQSTTLSILNKSQFSKIDVCIPKNKDIQKKIAGVLGALDDKIELNNKINNNLEQQAQTLFKSWFVDFEPFGGTMPEDWKEQDIYSIANIIYGAPFASKLFNTEKRGKPIIRIRDLKNQYSDTYTEEVHPKAYIIRAGDIVVGMDGEFRPYIWGNDEGLLNQRVCVFENKRPMGKMFLYLTIKPLLNRVEQTEVATTVIHIGKQDFDAFKFNMPVSDILDKFDKITNPIYDKIVSNSLENTRLAAIRDALLPKLMSGEIDVSNVDISALTSTDKLSFTED